MLIVVYTHVLFWVFFSSFRVTQLLKMIKSVVMNFDLKMFVNF